MPIKKKENDILYVPKDVSAYSPHPINIGCGDISLPLFIKGKNMEFSTSCDVDFSLNLNKESSESIISKIVNKLLSQEYRDSDSLINLFPLEIYNVFDVQNFVLNIKFPYYILRETPVSKKEVNYKYDCSITLLREGNDTKYILKISVPYSSSCPVSKEISDYGAHNQRGYANISVELSTFNPKKDFWFEDIVSIVDKSCSSPVYNNTNLQDEAFQTEMLYENSLNIEDIAKNIAEKLKKQKIKKFNLVLEQKESINTYKTTAIIESKGYKNDT